MVRIASFAINQFNLARTLETQSRLFDAQIQIGSGKVSQDYTGIALDSRRLVNLKNAQAETQTYINGINIVDDRPRAMETNASGAFEVASRFRALLVSALNNETASVLPLNQNAEDQLAELAGLLNVKLDGRALFAGSRTDILPVDLDLLLRPDLALVNAAELTGGATTTGTGIKNLTGIVNVQVESGTSGDAFQLDFNSGTNQFTMTNLNGGLSQTVALGTLPAVGETKDLTFLVGPKRVVLTIDSTFDSGTSITTDTITGNIGGGAGAFGAISVTGTTGDISKITQNTIEITGTAAAATLTLNSSDGNFVASPVDLSAVSAPLAVTLLNTTTGASISLDVNVTTGLDDAAVFNANTEIRLDNFLENVAVSIGTVNVDEARPNDPGYDSSKPGYYKGDTAKATLRITDDMTVEYGITADQPGFEKLIRALYMVRIAKVSPGNIDRATLESALGLAAEAIKEIPDIVAQIGADGQTLAQLKNSHEDFLLSAQNTVSRIEDVDVAAAVARLSIEQTQLEASYMLTAQLRQLSLANFLR